MKDLKSSDFVQGAALKFYFENSVFSDNMTKVNKSLTMKVTVFYFLSTVSKNLRGLFILTGIYKHLIFFKGT